MRLFVAFDLPEAVKDALERDVVAPLRPALPGARWTRPEGRHVTVKFLGEVAEGRVGAVVEALAGAAARHEPFRAALDRLGGFPSLRRPRVLWVGVGEGAEAMARVAAGVEGVLEPLGFPREGRGFAAHLTLARFRTPAPLGRLPEVQVPASAFDVGELVLFRSVLRAEGAVYSPLERFRLGGSPPGARSPSPEPLTGRGPERGWRP